MWVRIVLLLCVFHFAGCMRVQLYSQAAALNDAVAKSENEQLFLNIVRASLDLPVSITRLRTFTGKERASGRIDPSLPFGADASRAFTIGPEISLSPGITSTEYANINISASLESLNQSLSPPALIFFIKNGYDPIIVITVLVSRLEASAELVSALLQERKRICHSANNQIPSCKLISNTESECGLGLNRFRLEKGEYFVSVRNKGQSRCEFARFQAFNHLLRLSALVVDLVETEVAIPGKDKHGNPIQEIVKRRVLKTYFQNERVERVKESIKLRFEALGIEKIRSPLKSDMRTPKSVISYLGQLIRLQRDSPDLSPITVVLPNGRAVEVFNVHTDTGALGRPAISVKGPDGRHYSISYPDFRSSVRDQSLRVLTLANDIINPAIASKVLPAPSTVVFR